MAFFTCPGSMRGITRRHLLEGMAGALTAQGLAAGAVQSSSKARSKYSLPGLYRGRVVAAEHAGSIVSGAYQADAVRSMMERGMGELTGAETWAAAWKKFVERGDVVGIKVNPVGRPHVISDGSVVRSIIAGLNAAGVPNKDIVVYDRYREEFLQCGFDKWLPSGVRTASAAERYDDIQLDIKGYDPAQYIDMQLTLPGHDISEARARRSHASLFISKQVNKLINLCVLKDHQSAGVTLALKNLSHGHVNNVCRSHSTRSLNACGAFIPAVVAMPVIRDKVVLNILDGVKGLYHGGPGSANREKFVWEHKTMYFATDPVAMDRIGWGVIDDKRVASGMKKLADDYPDTVSTFVRRQPEHVEIAGAMGLGEFDLAKIDLRKVKVA